MIHRGCWRMWRCVWDCWCELLRCRQTIFSPMPAGPLQPCQPLLLPPARTSHSNLGVTSHQLRVSSVNAIYRSYLQLLKSSTSSFYLGVVAQRSRVDRCLQSVHQRLRRGEVVSKKATLLQAGRSHSDRTARSVFTLLNQFTRYVSITSSTLSFAFSLQRDHL
jgi:hypothetical protein